MKADRIDRALGQQGAKAEREVRGLDHFLHSGGEDHRKPLPAVIRIKGQAVPASLHVLPVRVPEALRLHDLALLDPCSLLVSAPVQRGDRLLGELCRPLEDRLDQIRRRLLEPGQRGDTRHPDMRVEHEADVQNRCLVITHRVTPSSRKIDGPALASARRPARRAGPSLRRRRPEPLSNPENGSPAIGRAGPSC